MRYATDCRLDPKREKSGLSFIMAMATQGFLSLALDRWRDRVSRKCPFIAASVFHCEFEFIHPFADGSGRMSRLCQSLILARWNPLYADMPVESLVFDHQRECYLALQESSSQAGSAPFITLMLQMILDTLSAFTPKSLPYRGSACGASRGDEPRSLAWRPATQRSQIFSRAVSGACVGRGPS